MRKKIAFATIADRDALFFIKIAKILINKNYSISFLAFHEPTINLIKENGFEVSCITKYLDCSILELDRVKVNEYENQYNIKNIRNLIKHEKLTFGLTGEEELIKKAISYLNGIKKWLLANKPDIVIQELGGFIAPLSLYYVAKSEDIRHIFLEPMMFKGTLGMVENTIDYSLPKINAKDLPSQLEVDQVKAYISEYNKNHNIIIPSKDRHHFSDATVSKIINLKNLKKITKKIWNKYILHTHQEYDFILNHLKVQICRLINRKLLKKYYFNQNLDDKFTNQFLYYPLHVPLDFQLTVRSPEWLNQIQLLEFIADSLPYGIELWIKEHPASIGAYSKNELKNLIKKNNVKLLEPMINSGVLISRCAATITINSKVGAEALMQNKTVFVLGDPFYAQAKNVIKAKSYFELANELQLFFKKQRVDLLEKLDNIDFFLRIHQHSFTGELYDNSSENIINVANMLLAGIEGKGTLKS